MWISASTLRRVLAAQGLILPEPPARDPAPRVLWPDRLRWEPNKIWCWDVTHFPRARRVAFAIVDVVSRRWIDTLVSTEETSTQVRVIFDRALAAEGLTELITPERVEQFTKDPTQPILLACSDNGPQMTSTATRDLFAALAVAQRLGRPRTPTGVLAMVWVGVGESGVCRALRSRIGNCWTRWGCAGLWCARGRCIGFWPSIA